MAAAATKFHLFHQNMMVFGGGASVRNEAFKKKMWDISQAIGSDRILVAGFTEIINDGKTLEAIKEIAIKLDPGLTVNQAFACGQTALNQKQIPEYIIISAFNSPFKGTFTLKISGRVLLVSNLNKKSWQCFPSTELAIDAMPKNFVPDSRGVAYVGGTYQGKDMIVGFMHNMYGEGDRSGGFQSLDVVSGLIREKHKDGGWGDKDVFIGGDFNVQPRAIRSDSTLWTICARVDPNDGESDPVSTTSTHPYDFWLSTYFLTPDYAKVWTQTRDKSNNLSDHAGITLKLPWW
jgi:hypothetical protein